MSLNAAQTRAVRHVLSALPFDEADLDIGISALETELSVPVGRQEIIDQRAAFLITHDPVVQKIMHLRILRDEVESRKVAMKPKVLTAHAERNYGRLIPELQAILRKQYLPVIGHGHGLDWDVADQLDAAGFTVGYDKAANQISVAIGESALVL